MQPFHDVVVALNDNSNLGTWLLRRRRVSGAFEQWAIHPLAETTDTMNETPTLVTSKQVLVLILVYSFESQCVPRVVLVYESRICVRLPRALSLFHTWWNSRVGEIAKPRMLN